MGTVISLPIITTRSSSIAEEEEVHAKPQIELEEGWTSTPVLETCVELGTEKNNRLKARYYLCLGEIKDNQEVRKPRLFYNKLEKEQVEAFNLLKIQNFSWGESSPQKLKLGLTNISHANLSSEVEWPSFLTKRVTAPSEKLIPEVNCSLTEEDISQGSYVFSCEGTHWSVVEQYKNIRLPKSLP